MSKESWRFKAAIVAITASCALLLASTVAPVAAQSSAGQASSAAQAAAPDSVAGAEDITYAEHVAPIIQENCQICHQPGSIAPFSLLTYSDVRRVGGLIKARVSERIMPPWHIDRTIGIQEFKNDRGLSDEEIATIVAWVDAGTPEGDPADLPPPADFPDPDAWQLAPEFGEPDLVVASEPYTLAAQTQDKWFRPVTETGLTEPRWVKAIEIRPVGAETRRITHHVLAFLVQDEEDSEMSAGAVRATATGAMGGPGLFMEWAVGKVGEIFPDGAGKLMLPNSRIRWEVHMHAMGREVKDSTVELGVWFYPPGEEPRNRTRLRMFDARGERGDLDIPPGEIAVTQRFHVLRWPTRLENFQPHMHMRGKMMRMAAVYPDGSSEILSQVSNFRWNWHVNYIYADHAAPLLPAGTVLVITAWHDNTADNPNNPDPEQWVGWGDRTIDEMAHAWVDVTYLSQEEFDALVAEREARKAEGGDSRR
jgi:mono/diheme cytochrome c family protein